MKYWDASGIVPLLVRQARTREMQRILEEDQRMSEAGHKEGFRLAVCA